jgi:hypothetical protein
LGSEIASSPSRQSALGPRDKIQRAQDELEPRVVRDHVAERQVAHPIVLPSRIRSSTRAWPRWRSSRSAASPSEFVMKHCWPPLDVEEAPLCAGMGTLAPREALDTFAPSRQVEVLGQLGDERAVTDGADHCRSREPSPWANSKAALTFRSAWKPIENSQLRSTRASTSQCVAIAESARARIGCTTASGSSRSSCPIATRPAAG